MKQLTTLGLLGSIAISGCGTAGMKHETSSKPAAHCAGSFAIRNDADVRKVAGLCRSIDGDLRVLGTSLTSLDGLEGVHSVRYLVVAENPMLENVKGLRGLASARGVTFMDNPALGSLEGLEGATVQDGLVIVNTGIRSLRGLGDVNGTREIVLVGNRRLESLDGLASVDGAEVIDIENNGAKMPRLATPTDLRAATQSNAARTDG